MVDIDVLSEVYFSFDLPVDYQLKNKTLLKIYPIVMEDYGLFSLYSSILKIDKNISNDAKVIAMSYLDFLCEYMFKKTQNSAFYLGWILHKCLHCKCKISFNERNKAFLIGEIENDVEDSKEQITITSKEFEDIRRIILYQNILHYDDSYIDPELKKSMQEVDELKSKKYSIPNIERKFAMITAHCGLPKKDQLQMTMRSHQYLFDEVCGEVEFTTVRPIALYAGKDNELNHWVYRNRKDKFDGYLTTVEQYNKSMGGDGAIHKINTNNNMANGLMEQFSSFNK